MNFASDNAVGASAVILAAIADANAGALPAYGADPFSRDAEQALSAFFEREVAAFLVATGTAANALAVGAFSPPWGATLCHAHSHLANDECGAPEFFAGGAKLLLVEGAAGKITPATLELVLAQTPRDVAGDGSRGHRVVRQSRPMLLSLSQATEAGTLYSLDEIAALSALAHARGLAVHMDGARFANAVVALGCTPADMTWRAGVDVLSLGASKNGALACEAVVFFDPARADGFAHQRKRGGHTLSKGRFLGAQMLAWLRNDHWRMLATHANTQAARLAAALAPAPGVRIAFPCQANEVFAVLPQTMADRLRAEGVVFTDWHAGALEPAQRLASGEMLARFVASFALDPADVDRFALLLRSFTSPASGP